MKSIVMPKNVQLKENTQDQLSGEVNGTTPSTKKKITVVDMWNRHRNRRSASTMIRKWNFN